MYLGIPLRAHLRRQAKARNSHAGVATRPQDADLLPHRRKPVAKLLPVGGRHHLGPCEKAVRRVGRRADTVLADPQRRALSA
jgi:hypothetical protein